MSHRIKKVAIFTTTNIIIYHVEVQIVWISKTHKKNICEFLSFDEVAKYFVTITGYLKPHHDLMLTSYESNFRSPWAHDEVLYEHIFKSMVVHLSTLILAAASLSNSSTQRTNFRSVANMTYCVTKRIHLQLKVKTHWSFK